MAVRTEAETRVAGDGAVGVTAGVVTDGLLAGLVGGIVIAAWFLAYDTLVMGRAFYTPTVLGAALFRSGAGLETPAAIAPSLDLVLPFTWIHLSVFCIIGATASYLLTIAERNANYGFGVLLLFVVFEFGFVLLCQVVAESVLDALAWPAVLIGNLLAASAMAAVLWRRHRQLSILP
jgi:hypothetical protein